MSDQQLESELTVLREAQKMQFSKLLTAIIAGAVGMMSTAIYAAISVRDTTIRHEVRISDLEKRQDKCDIKIDNLITQNIKNK
jgi:hypothetical protein